MEQDFTRMASLGQEKDELIISLACPSYVGNVLPHLVSSNTLETAAKPDAYLWASDNTSGNPVPENTLLCHKLFLAAASPIFDRILSELCPCSDAHIICPGMSYEELSWIKNYIYTGQIILSSHKVSSFFSLVNLLDLPIPTSEVLFTLGIPEIHQELIEGNEEQESGTVEVDSVEHPVKPTKLVYLNPRIDPPEPTSVRRSSRIRKPSRFYEIIKSELSRGHAVIQEDQIKEEREENMLDEEISDSGLSETVYLCSFCNETFIDQKLLILHKKTHSEERPYHCSACDKTFRYPTELNSHMRTHTGEKPFVCDICKRSFAHRSTLSEHLNIHSSEKPYGCEICLRRFSQRKGLRAHRCDGQQQDGDGFQCEYCGRNFVNRKAIALHRIHHEEREPGQKSFLCDVCGRGFRNKYILQNHQITHTDERNFVCEACGKSFAQKKHLQAHLYVHSSEARPYRCSHCEKSFRYVANLEAHERVHTGQKPFVCHLCHEVFRQKAALKEHLSSHTGLDCSTCSKTFATRKKLAKHLYSHSMANLECPTCHERFGSAQKLESHSARHLEPATAECQAHSIITLEVVPEAEAADGELVLTQSMMHIMETPTNVTGEEPWTFEVVIPES